MSYILYTLLARVETRGRLLFLQYLSWMEAALQHTQHTIKIETMAAALQSDLVCVCLTLALAKVLRGWWLNAA